MGILVRSLCNGALPVVRTSASGARGIGQGGLRLRRWAMGGQCEGYHFHRGNITDCDAVEYCNRGLDGLRWEGF